MSNEIPAEWHKHEAFSSLSKEEFELLQNTYEVGDDLPCDCDECGSFIIWNNRRCDCGNRRCYLVYNKHLAPPIRKEFPFSVEVY